MDKSTVARFLAHPVLTEAYCVQYKLANTFDPLATWKFYTGSNLQSVLLFFIEEQKGFLIRKTFFANKF